MAGGAQDVYLFDACVGIGSVQMRNHPHNKGLTMSKMPPMATSGKLANNSKRKHARQVLESKQRQHDGRYGQAWAGHFVTPLLYVR